MKKNISNKVKLKNSKYIILVIIMIVLLVLFAGTKVVKTIQDNNLNKRLEQETEVSMSEAKTTLENAIKAIRQEYSDKGETFTKDNLPKIDSDKIDVRSTESFPIKVICQNYEFSVNESFAVTYVGKAEGTIVTYTTTPSGYTNKDSMSALIIVKNEKGIKEIERSSGHTIYANGRDKVALDYEIPGNGTYTIKVRDMDDNEITKNIVIDLIDKEVPLNFTPTVQKSGTTITITPNAQDANATATSTKSGISRYEYYVDNVYRSSNQIDVALGNHTVYVIAYDRAGNKRQSTAVSITIKLDFVEISAGRSEDTGAHDCTLAIDDAGNLYAWGYNDKGKLGTGDTNTRTVPTKIKSGTKFKKVSVGYHHSLAIDESGNLWGWGQGTSGALGNGSQNDSYVPIPIKSGTKFKEVSAGNNYSMAIDELGNLWTWGANSYGKLGDDSNKVSYVPINIKSGTKFKKISAGYVHSMAIDESGNLWTWGYNGAGRLGNNSTTSSKVPINIKSGTKFKEISAGQAHSMAIDESGNLWTWGYNGFGILGNDSTTSSKVPINIKSGTKFKEISAGEHYSLAIDTSNDLWAWGYNGSGQLGDGTKTQSKVPIKIKSGIKKISAGEYHSLAIDTSNDLWAWGIAQLGNGTTQSSVPINIK